LLFSLTSWLCGIAPNIGLLVLFRALQGAVAGSLIPLSQSLLLMNYPKEKAGMALAFWAMIVVIAPILGPILGGWITDNYGWSWIFFINIPLGIISAVMSWSILKKRENPTQKLPIDLTGFGLLFCAVSSLQVCLDKGQQLEWFESNFICTLAAISTVSFIIFTIWELYCPYPIVDFSFFRKRNFLLGLITSTLGFTMFFGSMILLPMWLQNYNNYTAYAAGLAVAPIGIASLFLSPLVGKFLTKIDLRFFPFIGFIVFSWTFFWFSELNTQISIWQIVEGRLIQGIGVAFFFMPLITLSLSGIPPQKLPSASGLINFIRILCGGGLGTSLFIAAFNQRMFWHQSYLLDAINPYNENLNNLKSSYDSLGQPASESFYASLQASVIQQSSMLALNDIFWCCGWGFIVLIFLLWWCKPPKSSNEASVISATH
jgi:DHA2 family multidrug resistance protein